MTGFNLLTYVLYDHAAYNLSMSCIDEPSIYLCPVWPALNLRTACLTSLLSANALQTSLGTTHVLQTSLGTTHVLQTSLGTTHALQTSLGTAHVLQTSLGTAHVLQTSLLSFSFSHVFHGFNVGSVPCSAFL